jgi:hypothetical protein
VHASRAGWQPVWEGNGEAQALIVAGGLETCGIDARVQGARPIDGLPHAFQASTWAVFVANEDAERARDVLRDQGEGAAILSGDGERREERTATLRFVVYLFLGCVAFTLILALWQAL